MLGLKLSPDTLMWLATKQIRNFWVALTSCLLTVIWIDYLLDYPRPGEEF